MPARAKALVWDGSIYGLPNIGRGGTSLAFAVDDRRVIKVPIPSPFGLQAIEQEREVYRRLGNRLPRYVITCYDPNHSSGLLLERCTGSYAEAEKMHRQTLGLRETVLGREHPDTLASMNNLAESLRQQGKYPEAEKMHRQTLGLMETVLGREHPDTLMSMNNLAKVLRNIGRHSEVNESIS
ncbi:hypothetical protein PG993_012468 [Apiospora rasikravindrae]|uniref:Tetratricopeptide repeat protein n=1 Tax=Apiospora rasikravindrae TaxID=990691 RepID=A0ABR1S2G2_9PEZI